MTWNDSAAYLLASGRHDKYSIDARICYISARKMMETKPLDTDL